MALIVHREPSVGSRCVAVSVAYKGKKKWNGSKLDPLPFQGRFYNNPLFKLKCETGQSKGEEQ